MANVYEEILLKSGRILQIIYDTDAWNPREDDNISIIAAFHRKYSLGDKNLNFSEKQFNGWDEMEEHIINNEEAIVCLPLTLYDHGGISISIGRHGPRFDSGQVGYVYTTKEKLDYNGIYQGDGDGLLNDESFESYKKRITEYIQSEIDTYEYYLTGDVYGFKLIEKDNQGNDVEIDSCWGFYGSDYNKNGILDNLSKEDQPLIT